MAIVHIGTPGSYHHHCKEIQDRELLQNAPFHIKPLRMTLFTSQSLIYAENSVESYFGEAMVFAALF